MHHVRLKFLDRGWKFKSRSERWTDGIIREFCLHVNLRYFSYIRMTCSNASNLLDERKSKVNARTKVSDITLNTFVDHLKLWVMDNQNSHNSITHSHHHCNILHPTTTTTTTTTKSISTNFYRV
ncbi:MAG: hypothetical protein ACI8RD_006233 [Bacillariaceae sp.]|jgi:hypothetical protein